MAGSWLLGHVGDQNGLLDGRVEQTIPFMTTILSGSDDNALVRHKTNLSLEERAGENPCSHDRLNHVNH